MLYRMIKNSLASRKPANGTSSNATETVTEKPAKTKTCAHQEQPWPKTDPCSHCKAETSARRKYRWKIIAGLLFPAALQALDSTIIASALPWIAGDFGKISQLNWIVSVFNLTSAAFIPFWAQMSDVFGRNAALNASLVLMLVGSALCTGAPTSSFPCLLLGRAFQGMAAAGINVLVRTILADRVSLEDNAKNWAIFALVSGLSYALGPVIGGYLTSSNWRWCFGINLPIGAVALILVFFILRKELLGPQPIPELDETVDTGRRTKFTARIQTVDFGGQILILAGLVLVILALTWAGVTYAWTSPAVLVSLILGVILVVSFVIWEYMFSEGRLLARKLPKQRPMIPWVLLSYRDVGLLFFTESVTGMGMFAVLYFCNIYFISVKGFTSDQAGVQLLYFTPGLGVGVYLCSFLINRWPRMTFVPIFMGTLIEMVGIGMLAWAMYSEQTPAVYGFMATVGAGVGLRFMGAPLHGIGLFREHRASIIALLAIAVPFGGTIGLTIMSTVFNNLAGLNAKTDFTKVQSDQPSEAEMHESIYKAKMGVVWAFVALVPFAVLAFLAAMTLGNVKIRKGAKPGEDANIIIRRPYLLTLLRGESGTEDVEGRGAGAHEFQRTQTL